MSIDLNKLESRPASIYINPATYAGKVTGCLIKLRDLQPSETISFIMELTSPMTTEIAAQLKAAGMIMHFEIEGTLLTARCPLEKLPEICKLDAIKCVQAPGKLQHC